MGKSEFSLTYLVLQYILSIQNKGLRGITATRNLDDWIHPQNSCEFELNKGERGGIRVKVLMDYIYVDKREADGSMSYQKCVVNQIGYPYFHHFAVVSNNQKDENRVSSIDIDAIFFKNYDSSVYPD